MLVGEHNYTRCVVKGSSSGVPPVPSLPHCTIRCVSLSQAWLSSWGWKIKGKQSLGWCVWTWQGYSIAKLGNEAGMHAGVRRQVEEKLRNAAKHSHRHSSLQLWDYIRYNRREAGHVRKFLLTFIAGRRSDKYVNPN